MKKRKSKEPMSKPEGFSFHSVEELQARTATELAAREEATKQAKRDKRSTLVKKVKTGVAIAAASAGIATFSPEVREGVSHGLKETADLISPDHPMQPDHEYPLADQIARQTEKNKLLDKATQLRESGHADSPGN